MPPITKSRRLGVCHQLEKTLPKGWYGRRKLEWVMSVDSSKLAAGIARSSAQRSYQPFVHTAVISIKSGCVVGLTCGA